MNKATMFALADFVILDAVADEDCDASLKLQGYSSSSNYDFNMAQLNLINEENYSGSKQSLSGSYYNIARGDYSSFNEERRKLFSESKYLLSTKESSEVYRSYLTDAQLDAWLRCKRGAAQPIVRYNRTGQEVTSVQIEWNPSEPVGRFFVDASTFLSNVSSQPKLTELTGETNINLKHLDPGKPIIGAINGHTGSHSSIWSWADTWRDRTAYIYIPAVPKLDSVDKPLKFAVPIVPGRAKTSWAYWKGKQWPTQPGPGEIFRQDWECTVAPKGMTLIIVGDLETKHLGNHKGQCVQGAEFCTHLGAEYCTDLTISKGCFVNDNWLDWYKMTTKRSGLNESNDQICQGS